MQHHGLKMLILIAMIGMIGCLKNDPVLEPIDTEGHLQANLRNGDTVSVLMQLFADISNQAGLDPAGMDMATRFSPDWNSMFYLNDSVILVPCRNGPYDPPFVWSFLHYMIGGSSIELNKLQMVPDGKHLLTSSTIDGFKNDFTGWSAVFSLGNELLDATHFSQGLADTIVYQELQSGSDIRWYWWQWWDRILLELDGGGHTPYSVSYSFYDSKGNPLQFLCGNCGVANQLGTCQYQHCIFCSPGYTVTISMVPLPPKFRSYFSGTNPNSGTNPGGSTGGSGSGGSGNILSNMPSDFIDNFLDLDSECRKGILKIAKVPLSKSVWECLGASCGSSSEGPGDGGANVTTSLVSDVVEILANELEGVNLVDPCYTGNPKDEHKDLFNEFMESVCAKGIYGKPELLDELDEKNWIKSNFQECKLLNCVWSKLRSQPGYLSKICNQYAPPEVPIGLNLKYDKSAQYQQLLHYNNGEFSGETKDIASTFGRLGPNGNNEGASITIVVNKHVANGIVDPLKLAAILIHEMKHAEWLLLLVEDFDPPGQYKQNDFSMKAENQHWVKIVAKLLDIPEGEVNDDIANHHNAMQHFVGEMAPMLRAFNNNAGEVDDYKYFMYDLLTGDDQDLIGYEILTQSQLDYYKTRSQNILYSGNCN